MRHSFALAMAKLRMLFNYPRCDVPSVEQLKELMAREHGCGASNVGRTASAFGKELI